jgi:hypothetical protein
MKWDTSASGLIDARREVGLEINLEKTKFLLLSHDHRTVTN